MDSLLPIATKKQKLHQTDKYFNFHSVGFLSQVPLACGSSALPSPWIQYIMLIHLSWGVVISLKTLK